MPNTFKKGDHVRVEFDGTIEYCFDDDGKYRDQYCVAGADKRRRRCHADELTLKQPTWTNVEGAVVLTSDGLAAQCDGTKWALTGGTMRRSYEELERQWGPLTLIHNPDGPFDAVTLGGRAQLVAHENEPG